MILDGHIHIGSLTEDCRGFASALRRAGVGGGIVISLAPQSFPSAVPSASSLDRMNNALRWCEAAENLYPFYWIDPIEADAADQVVMAVGRGAMGFKVICDRYFPGDKRALEIFSVIAATGKPILFHSGILWDGKPSSRYNRPAEFEALLAVKGLRFSLAHISWPWTDELIAVYGKFLNALGSDSKSGVEMFVDLTPGTPPIYRREALTRLFTVGYDVGENVFFGSDSCADNYNAKWVQAWLERDKSILAEIGLKKRAISAVYADNLKRFVGLSSARVRRKVPKPGE